MIRKKMVMVGASSVGKTSLVSRYVFGIFSPRYQKTVGVSIDRKNVEVDDRKVTLMLWDLQGEDDRSNVRMSFVKGSSGFFLVVDGTRSHILEVAMRLHDQVLEAAGAIPFALLINKCDLRASWQVTEEEINALRAKGWDVVQTSAKDGEGVEDAFLRLTKRMIG